MTEPTRLSEAELERLLAHVDAAAGITVYTVGESYAFQQADVLTRDVVRALVEEVRRLWEHIQAGVTWKIIRESENGTETIVRSGLLCAHAAAAVRREIEVEQGRSGNFIIEMVARDAS